MLKSLFVLSFFFAAGLVEAYPRYTYDFEANQCKDSSGRLGNNSKYLGTCGSIKNYSAAKFQRRLDNGFPFFGQGIQISDSELPQLNFQRADFQGAMFRGVDFTGTDFGNSDFRKAKFSAVDLAQADLSESDLRSADLTEALLDEADLEGARFDHLTQLPFDCSEAMDRGMIFQSSVYHLCSMNQPRAFFPSAEVRADYEGYQFFEADKVYVMSSKGFGVRPISLELSDETNFGVHVWDHLELLCTLKIKSCRRNRANVLSMYKMDSNPAQPFLHEGIELYHAELEDLQDWRVARWIGFYEIYQAVPNNFEDLASRLKRELGDDDQKEVQFQSWIDEALEVDVLHHWLPIDAVSRCFVYPDEAESSQRIKCMLRFDMELPVDGEKNLFQQFMNARVRRAPESTLSLRIKTAGEIRKYFDGDVEVSIPIQNLNFQAIDWPSFRRKN